MEVRPNSRIQTETDVLSSLETVRIPFDLLFSVQDPGSQNIPLGIMPLLSALDFQIQAFSQILAEIMMDGARRVQSELHRSLPGASQPGGLFDWIPSELHHASPGPPLHLFEIAQSVKEGVSLQGQKITGLFPPVSFVTGPVLAVRFIMEGGPSGDPARTYTVPQTHQELFQVQVETVVFQEGSLYSWVRGHMKVLTLATSLLSAGLSVVSTPIGAEISNRVHEHRMYLRIEQALKGSPLVRYRNFRFSEDELLEKAGAAFNYEAHGITDDERRNRIGMLQLALKLDLGIELTVDGEFGPATKAALLQFAKEHEHPATVASPFLRADFVRALDVRQSS